MKQLSEVGCYKINDDVLAEIQKNFIGNFADEAETAKTLKKFYEEYGYLADTHTSVALNCAEKYVEETNDNKKMVVVSTASPYKFAADVYKSITAKEASDGTAALDELSVLTNTEISYPLKDLDKRTVNFSKIIEKEDMLEEVYKFM
jgi:threonine synthase